MIRDRNMVVRRWLSPSAFTFYFAYFSIPAITRLIGYQTDARQRASNRAAVNGVGHRWRGMSTRSD